MRTLRNFTTSSEKSGSTNFEREGEKRRARTDKKVLKGGKNRKKEYLKGN